jgi:hypothetical protein
MYGMHCVTTHGIFSPHFVNNLISTFHILEFGLLILFVDLLRYFFPSLLPVVARDTHQPNHPIFRTTMASSTGNIISEEDYLIFPSHPKFSFEPAEKPVEFDRWVCSGIWVPIEGEVGHFSHISSRPMTPWLI